MGSIRDVRYITCMSTELVTFLIVNRFEKVQNVSCLNRATLVGHNGTVVCGKLYEMITLFSVTTGGVQIVASIL